MPEGHTIHRLAADHKRRFVGRPVAVSSPQGRFAAGAALLSDRVLRDVTAYGKHLFYAFGVPGSRRSPAEGDRVLHVHLGLYGTFLGGAQPAPAVRGALRLRLATDEQWADLRGPTACELIDPAGRAAIIARLGPDPLRRDADPARARAKLARRATPLGAALMDQSVVAGVGNVFRAEVLYRRGIDPHRPARVLDAAEWDALWVDLRALLRAGVRTGRIVTTRPEHRFAGRGPVSREDAYYVYRRAGEACRVCATPVRREVMAGRNLYWCPACQPC